MERSLCNRGGGGGRGCEVGSRGLKGRYSMGVAGGGGGRMVLCGRAQSGVGAAGVVAGDVWWGGGGWWGVEGECGWRGEWGGGRREGWWGVAGRVEGEY